MEIIKLNRRYTLGREGFVCALRFHSRSEKSYSVTSKLYQMYGDGWGQYSWQSPSQFRWATYTANQWRNDRPREFYIAFRDEKDMTAILLGINHV